MGVLRFKLFGFPVDIQPTFWLPGLLFGFLGTQSLAGMVVAVVVILVSILVHELGHAFAARRFGQAPRIVLYMFGGMTAWSSGRRLSRGQQIATALAGPAAGLALGFVSLLALASVLGEATVSELQPAQMSHAQLALLLFTVVNLFYGCVNLLPVLPFDGGQVLAAALGPERRQLTAHLSLAFGIVAAIVFWQIQAPILAMLFAFASVSTYFQSRNLAQATTPDQLEPVLAQARRALQTDKPEQAAAMARAVADVAQGELRRQALELVAWGALLSGDADAAQQALREAQGQVEPLLTAAVAEATGNYEAGVRALEGTIGTGAPRQAECVAALIRLLLQAGQPARACSVASSHLSELEPNELLEVASRAEAAGEHAAAAELRSQLQAVAPVSSTAKLA